MEDIDMRPGTELFPESVNQHNSYDVIQDQVVSDPLNTGVKPYQDVADQGQMSDKEYNFRALRDEAAKLKEEREYWKGQAEAFSRTTPRQPEPEPQDVYSALDWDDSNDVRKAFDSLRQQNESLRNEIKDSMRALETKSQYQDWNNMVTQHVPQLTNKNPIFAEMIQKASNPYEAAYLLSQLHKDATQPGAQLPHPMPGNGNAQRAIANAQKPQTLASVGGSSQLSAADYYASMSDKDFMALAGKHLDSI